MSNGYGSIYFSAVASDKDKTSYLLYKHNNDKNNYDLTYVAKFLIITIGTYYVKFTSIPFTAAQLHNADGTYVKTAGAAAGTTYYYDPNEGTWATTEPAAPTFSISGTKVNLDKTYLLTNGVSEKFANNLKDYAKGKNVLSADLTNATGTFDVTAMRSAIGATDGNNVLLYAPNTVNVGDANNVIVNGTAANLVITDKQPIDVPTAFKATKVSYSRANTKNSGDKQWGTICLPFALKSGNGIQYYELSEIDGNTMKVTEVTEVPANQPAIYSVATGASIEIGGEQVQIATTSEGKYPLTDGKLVLYGVQTAPITLKTDITPSPYYIAQNKFWQPTKNNVTVSPQRAYFISNDKATAKVLSIVEDGETTGISSAETSEPTIVGIYTVGGTKTDNLEKGINIVKMSDGTTKKIILK